MLEIRVNERELDVLSAKLELINKKAIELGAQPFKMFQAPSDHVRIYDGYNHMDVLPYGVKDGDPLFDVIIIGEGFRLGDYQVIGMLKRHQNSYMIINYTDKALEMKDWDINFGCEHCNTNRIRNAVYLLRDKKGHTTQVGSTCLRDFTGYDVNNLNYQERLLQDLKKDAEELKSQRHHYLSVKTYLAHVLAEIDANGFASKSKNPFHNTADYALESIDNHTNVSGYLDKAQQIIDWTHTVREEYSGDEFWHNLLVLTKTRTFHVNFRGYLAYLPIAYKKKTAPVTAKAYVGQLKDRIELDVTIDKVNSYSTIYGDMFIITMHDTDGNVLVWKTNTRKLLNVEKCRIKGTVKAHELFGNTKQTLITRVKVV